ncbi:MAG: cyclic nucleotide-binding domain-containing protein [Myxococcota bacterium]
MSSVAQLKKRLAAAVKAKKLDAALSALTALAREEPNVSNWPRRAAKLLRLRKDRVGELAALRRALELQVDQGQVLEAIASCKAILELSPDDPATLDTLDLLYVSGAGSDGVSAPPSASFSSAAAPGRAPVPDPLASSSANLGDSRAGLTDDGLISLLLTEVVPGAHAVQFADAEPGQINEIPVDSMTQAAVRVEPAAGVPASSPMSAPDPYASEDVLDLKLEEVDTAPSFADLAAAQAVSLPPRSATDSATASMAPTRESRPRRRPGDRHRGASLRRELANVPLFGDLDSASLQALIQKVRVVNLAAEDVLFRQGDSAKSLYVIVSGAVVPIAEGPKRRKLAVLEQGAFFGEIGLITAQPRNATIEALVETKLLAIDRRAVRDLIKREPSVAKSILRFLRARLIDRLIRTHLFFSAFAHAEREAVARQFRVLEVKDGTRVVEEGQPAEGLFVVLAGALQRTKTVEGVPKTASDLELGDVFGAASLLEGRGSEFDVTAQGKCWLVVLGEARFRRIVEANPCLVRILNRLSSEDAADFDSGGSGAASPSGAGI